MKFAIALTALPAALALSGKATTTRYFDGQKGACGCGPANGSNNFDWQLNIASGVYTAAGSPSLFGSGTWCGSGCGSCYKLTSTGSAPAGQGSGGEAGKSIIVMLTNLCPHEGNEKWCPASGGTNDAGMSYHFDIMAQSQVFGDNPIVDFESIACPSQATTDFKTCQCASS
ncbi:hypothetical protein VHEMI08042 [[Torrubiella] hemipterigena]|uniref:Cellulase n=1 Tax=[Torrubiella] hemipterigena TaxID=1531966 RepID=A0A0A1TNZ7_9HYPO|nr:hypothetical protein VHEMI08042 [[Torrubiella] hemipterigena]